MVRKALSLAARTRFALLAAEQQQMQESGALCRYNHGILTMYEWGEDVGGMERSRYIEGQPRDLYHFDHFMGAPHICSIVSLRHDC